MDSGRAYIYTLDVEESGSELLNRISLPNDFLDRANRYKKESVRFRSLCAYSLLFYALDELMIPPEALVYVGNGKPDFSNIHFNVSHSGDIVAVIISTHPCGIDVQAVSEAKGYEDVAKRVLSPELYKSYLEANSRPDFFARAWAMLEAKVKTQGCGIATSDLYLTSLGYPAISLGDAKGVVYYLSYNCVEDDVRTKHIFSII